MTGIDFEDPRNLLWCAAAAMALLGVFAAFADHRQGKRRDLDRVGLVSWNLVQVLAFFAAAGAVILALKG